MSDVPKATIEDHPALWIDISDIQLGRDYPVHYINGQEYFLIAKSSPAMDIVYAVAYGVAWVMHRIMDALRK